MRKHIAKDVIVCVCLIYSYISRDVPKKDPFLTHVLTCRKRSARSNLGKTRHRRLEKSRLHVPRMEGILGLIRSAVVSCGGGGDSAHKTAGPNPRKRIDSSDSERTDDLIDETERELRHPRLLTVRGQGTRFCERQHAGMSSVEETL